MVDAQDLPRRVVFVGRLDPVGVGQPGPAPGGVVLEVKDPPLRVGEPGQAV